MSLDTKEKIFVSEISYNKAKATFEELTASTEFEFVGVPEEESALADNIKSNGVRGFIADLYPYEGALYEALGENGAISRYGVGHDSIDKQKATAAGVHVANTPGVLNNAVAEQAIWFLGALARKVVSTDRGMRANQWAPEQGVEVKGRKLTILGFGRIGQEICRKAVFGLGMDVTGYDLATQDDFVRFSGKSSFEEFQKEVPVSKISNDLKEAVSDADFVIIMMAVTPETVGFANKELFSYMKPSAQLINTARGALVNENDLYDALQAGDITGAALDVFIEEPYKPQDESKDLRTLQNIVITPHVASNTEETNHAMATTAAHNVMTILTEGADACKNIVNR